MLRPPLLGATVGRNCGASLHGSHLFLKWSVVKSPLALESHPAEASACTKINKNYIDI